MKRFKVSVSSRLFYLIGPSGAGKDSLITYARKRINGGKAVLFAHRYITRPPLVNDENHVALSEKEFLARAARGFFAMHWQRHACHYGVGSEIDIWLTGGCHVVVNGSRTYLPQALALYPRLKVILIDVAYDRLKHRLLARGRESSADIQKRLLRNRQFKEALLCNLPDIIVINNDGPLEAAGEQLVRKLL